MSEFCQNKRHGRTCDLGAGHDGRHNDGNYEWHEDECERPLRGGFPLQPIAFDEHGVARFRANTIVRFLLDNGPFDLNYLGSKMAFSAESWEQFAQLIGYSVGGFGELSYVSNQACEEADEIVERMRHAKHGGADL